jgi:hypothetical protein
MSAVMLAYFCFYLVFCLFNTNLLNPNNLLLLVLPVALILSRNAALAGGESLPSQEAGLRREAGSLAQGV